MDYGEFISALGGTFGELSPIAIGQFRDMEALYLDWNAKINVISRKDIEGGFYLHHVLHSLAIAEYLLSERPSDMEAWQSGARVLDLGTGGGFPGIPLAILFPQTHFTLCDSIGKKVMVASEVASSLGLSNVETVNARAESLGRSFDFVVSRAVTSLDNFYPWVRGRYGTSVLCLKGGDVAAETGTLMSRHRLRPGSVSTRAISRWQPSPWFEGKFVVEIRK